MFLKMPMRFYSALLAWLLHYANARPPVFSRDFYDLKTRLLHRFAEFRGHEIQEILKECWGGYHTGCGPKCTRCGGTGVFDLFWVRLERWQWGRYVFHCPAGRTCIKPASVQIRGRIEHAKYGRASNEALLWLYLLTGEWRLLWRSLPSSRMSGRYAWPMLTLQRVIFPVRVWLRWRKCSCGKWFPTRGSGWLVCRKCRWRKATGTDEEIPF